MYHGLSAYNRIKNFDLDTAVSRIEFLKNGYEATCWADKPIGPLGVFADPDHVDLHWEATPEDGYSFVSWFDDRRHFGKDSVIEREKTESNYDFYKRVSGHVGHVSESKKLTSKYAEFLVYKADPDAVWYNTKFGRIWYLRAKKLSNKLNLPLISVNF